MSKLLCSCAGRRRRRRGSSSSSRTPTPTPRAQRRRHFPRDDVLRVPPAGGPWTPGSEHDRQPPRIVHPFPDVVAGQLGTSDPSRPPLPQAPPPPVSDPPETRECAPPPPAGVEPSAPSEMELSSVRSSSTSDEGSLPSASRERLAHSKETLPVDADAAPYASAPPLTGSGLTRPGSGSLRKARPGSSSAVDDPCCKDSGDVWVKMDPSSAVLPRRKISGRSPAASVDQVWSKAGARRRLYDGGAAWSAEDFTDQGDDIWVRANTKPAGRQEQPNQTEPAAIERLSADPSQAVPDGPGTSTQGAKGKSLTLDRGSATKLKSEAKEERSSFLNWLWTLFRSKHKDTKGESALCGSQTREGATASSERVLQTEEKSSVKGEKVLGEAARAVLTGSDFRLIDDGGGDVYEDACNGEVLPDGALNQGQDDVVINPEIAKRLEDIDEVLKAVYERNIAYGRSVSMQRLGVSPGYKYQGSSREGSREADGNKCSSHLSLSRLGERTALSAEGETSHKCHEKKISVGSSSPSSFYSHSRSESELTNDDEFLALGAPPPPPKVKPSQAGYMRLSEPNFSNAECARFKVGRFLQQSNDEQWFGHSDQSLEGRLTGHHEAVTNTDDTNSASVPGEGSAAVEDKLLSLTSTFDAGVRAIRKDIEQCLASAQQSSASEASAAFISAERNSSKISRRSTPPTLFVTEEVEDNDRDLCGFTDDELDDILKISSTTDMEADEWADFDPTAWSRARGIVMPADSACYSSILPSGKQLVDVRQGEVEGSARDESWADIQRALQELVDSQDSALLQELKKAPGDETLLESVSEDTDPTKTEDVSLLETGLMSALTTSSTSDRVSSTQLWQSKNDSPQTQLTKGKDTVCPDATRSPATIGDVGMFHPFESMQEIRSQNDGHHHLNKETVTAPKDPNPNSNSRKGKQDPQSKTQSTLQPQFQEVPPTVGQSVLSPVTKTLSAPENESFFDEDFSRVGLPAQPVQQPMADVCCPNQGAVESLSGNLQSVSAVNVFTLSDETLNNLRSAAQHIKKSTALDLIAQTEELVESKLKTPETTLVDVLEEFPNAQGQLISLGSKEKDTRDKAESMSLDSLKNHDCSVGEQHQQTQSIPDARKISDVLEQENSLLEFGDFSDGSHATKAIDEFLGADLGGKKEINISTMAEKAATAEEAITNQPDNLTRADISSDLFCHFAEDWGFSSASGSNMPNEQSQPDVESKTVQSSRDTPLTEGWPLLPECQYEHKVAEVGTPDVSTVSQLFETTWQGAQSEEKVPDTVELPPVVSPPLTYQSNETQLLVVHTNLSQDSFQKPESGGKSGSPYDVLEEFVEVSTSSQIHNLKEQSHGLRDIENQMQCLKEQSHASRDTKSPLKSLREQSHDLRDIAGYLQKLKEESQNSVGNDSEGWIEHEADQSSAFRVTMGKTVDTSIKTASPDISADSIWLPLDRSLEDLKTPAVSFPPDLSSTSVLLPSVGPLPDLQVLDHLEDGNCNRFDTKNSKIENPSVWSSSVPQDEDTTTEKSDLMFCGKGGWDSPNASDSAWFPSEGKFFADDSCSEIKAHSENNKYVPTSDKGCGPQKETEWWSEKGFDSLDPFGMPDFSFTKGVQSETPQQWDSYNWTDELLSSNTSSSTPTDDVKAFSIDNSSYRKYGDPFSVASKETPLDSAIENRDLQQKLCGDPSDKSNTLSSAPSEISPAASTQFPKESVCTEQQQIPPVPATEQPSRDKAAAIVNNPGEKAPVSKHGTPQGETTSRDAAERCEPSLKNKQEMCIVVQSDPPKRLHSIGDDIVAQKSSESARVIEQMEADDSETLAPVADVKASVGELSARSRSDSPPPLVELSPSDTRNTLSPPEVAGSVVEEQHSSDLFRPGVSAVAATAASTDETVVSLFKPTELPAPDEFDSPAGTCHVTESESVAGATSTTVQTSSDSSTENQGVVGRAPEKSVTSGESALETDSYSEDSVFLDDDEGGDVLGKAGFILHPITRQLIRRSSSVSSEPLSPTALTALTGALAVTPENVEEEPQSVQDGGQAVRPGDATEEPQSAGAGAAAAGRRESVVLEKMSALRHHISEGIQHGKDSVYSTERKLLEKVHSWMAPAEKPTGKAAEKVLVEEDDVTEDRQTEPAVSGVLQTEENRSTVPAAHEAENKMAEKLDEKEQLVQTPSLHTSDSESKDKAADNQDEQRNIPPSPPPNVEYGRPAPKIDDALQKTSPPKEKNLALNTNFKEGSVGKTLVENIAAMETIPLTPEGDTIIEIDDFEYETIIVDRDPLLGQEFTITVKAGSDSEQSSLHSKTGFKSPQRLHVSVSNDETSEFRKDESPTGITGHFKHSEADSHRTTDGSSSPVGSDGDFFFDDIPQQSLEYGSQTPNPFLYEEDGSDDADVECGDSSRPATSSSDDWYFSTSRSVDGGLAISYGPPSNASSRVDLRKLDNVDTAEAGNSEKPSNGKEKDGSHLQLPVAAHKQCFLDVQHADLKPLSGEASPGGRSCASYDGPDYYDIEKRIDSVLKRIDALQESDPTFREPDSGVGGANPFEMSEDDWVCMQSGVPQGGLADLPDEPTVEGCGSTVEEDQRFLEETYLNAGKKSGRLQRVCTRQNLDGKEDLDANPFSIAADRHTLSSGSVLSSASSIPDTGSDSGEQDESSRRNPFLQTVYEKGLLSESALSVDLPNPFLYTEAEIRDQLRRAGFSSEEEIFPLSPPGGTVSEASSGVAGDRSCSPDSSSSDSSEGTLVQDPLPVPSQEVLLPAGSPDVGALPLRGTDSMDRDLDGERITKEAGAVVEHTTLGSERGTGAQTVRSINLPDVVSKDVSITQGTNSSGFQNQASAELQKCDTMRGLPRQVFAPVDVHPSKLAFGVSGLSVRTESGFQLPSRFSVSLAEQNQGVKQVGSDNCVVPSDKQWPGIGSLERECVECRLPEDTTESVAGELPDLVGAACSAVAAGGGGGQPGPQASLPQRLRAAATNEASNEGGRRAAPALDLAQNSNVQDAFVIAVEQQARERLERLSALKRIKPVDMTKLSQQLNQQSAAQAESEQQPSQQQQQQQQQLNGFIEGSPIYVTSLQSQAPPSRAKQGPPAAAAKAGSGVLSNGHAPQPQAQSQSEDSGDTLELKQELSDEQPECDQRPAGHTTVTTAIVEAPAHEQLIDNNAGSRHRESSELSSKKAAAAASASADDLLSVQQQAELELEMAAMEEGAPHREMAVDVPDSFVARTKTPPRYPPPRPRSQQGGAPNGSAPAPAPGGYSTPASPPKPVPPPRDHLRIEQDGRLVNRAPPPQLPARSPLAASAAPAAAPQDAAPAVVASPGTTPTRQQLDSIRKYQEQLRKRKEAEQQQEALNRSLRGSRKLQALESRPHGLVNDAYSSADDDDELADSQRCAAVRRVIGYGELVASLQRLQLLLKKCGGSALGAQAAAVQTLLLSPQFGRALAVHNRVQRAASRGLCRPPAADNAHALSRDCLEVLRPCKLPEAAELCDLLSRYEVEALLVAHDAVVATAEPRSPAPSPVHSAGSGGVGVGGAPGPGRESPPPRHEGNIRIVSIEKTNEPLGATVRNEGEAVIIGRIVRGGAAEKSGLLREGDEILEVNGIEMRGKSVNEVCDVLAGMTGTLSFLVVGSSNQPPPPPRETTIIHMKAHFDYDPEEDLYIPCRELGISFQKGDVLHVISQEDPNWWQAYREGEEDLTLAGLVPSKAFQHQREAMKQTIAGDRLTKEGKSKKASTLLCAKKNPKKKKKKPYGSNYTDGGYPLYANAADDYESDEILTYEEVALYYPRATHRRPVVLIGPPNIGRHELRQRLMEDSERFAAAVPHTSRPRKEGEVDGQDYHFISRAQFEADILARRFVEHGEYERAYYGTSLAAIRAVVDAGKTCVLNLHPQSLRILRASDLKPYVVFVAPPSLEKLRQKKARAGEAYKEEELKDIIEKAREMEDKYGHLFDLIIINNDTDRAFQQLLSEINSLEREPQWVPAAWVKGS